VKTGGVMILKSHMNTLIRRVGSIKVAHDRPPRSSARAVKTTAENRSTPTSQAGFSGRSGVTHSRSSGMSFVAVLQTSS